MLRVQAGRELFLIALATSAVVAGAAKCIENESTYVDQDGYTHIVGNMTNETGISASTVTLSGKLFDEGGNVIAETTALLCPVSVQPHSQNAFDLRFGQQNLPAAAKYEIRPIAGNTLTQALPDPHLTLIQLGAYRVGGTLAVSGSVRNDGATTFTDVMYCSAAYNAAGRVIKVQWSPIAGTLAPGQALRVPVVWPDLPGAATELVVWVSVGPAAQWVASARLPIQNSPPPG